MLKLSGFDGDGATDPGSVPAGACGGVSAELSHATRKSDLTRARLNGVASSLPVVFLTGHADIPTTVHVTAPRTF